MEQGTDAIISCVVDSISATATVAWTDSQGTAVSSDTTNYAIVTGTLDTDKQTTTLTVKAVANTEDTTYTCEFTIDGSSIEAAVNLNVFGK